MSSRPDHRRRQRSWERDDRDRDRDRHSRGGRGRGGGRPRYDDGRRRSSRSRSPRDKERHDRERHGAPDRREHRRDWEDDRRDRGERERRDGRDSKDSRGKDEGRERNIDREDRKLTARKEDSRVPPGRIREVGDSRNRPSPTPVFSASMPEQKDEIGGSGSMSSQSQPQPKPQPQLQSHTPPPRPMLDPDMPDEGNEEGEEMDAVNEDDAAMMTMMGMAGFGSTKGKHVEGNQEGSVELKKVRTWRQYMNRRGGFNRPLDKIK